MKIQDYIDRNLGYFVAPEVRYACEFLESHGEVFLLNFGLDNSTQKAAEMYTVFLDEDLWEFFRDFPKREGI